MKTKNSFIKNETRQVGAMGGSVYMNYLLAMQGRALFLPLLFVLLLLTSFFDSGFRYLVSLWVEQPCGKPESVALCQNMPAWEQKIRIFLQTADHLHIVFLFFFYCFLAIVIRALGWILLFLFLGNGARVLHDQMVESFHFVHITFFDENPTGRLIRRFSGDYTQVKDEIPNMFADILNAFFEFLTLVLIVLFQTPWAMVTVLPCGYFYFKMQAIFKAAAREAQRLIKVLETPVWSLFAETTVGYQSIRAYGRVDEFLTRFLAISKDYAKAVLLHSRFTRWLNLRLKLASEVFSLGVSTAVVILLVKGHMSTAQAGFLMSLTLGLDMMIQWFTRSFSLIEAKMVSFERVLEYTSLLPEQEKSQAEKSRLIVLPRSWPAQGQIEVKNLVMSYRSDLPLVFNNLSLTIPARKKIGLIGRTGAGKSSLFQTFFRMVHIHAGQILVDGIDILQIPVEKARHIFAIVPQDPHLFPGSIRYNLDRTGSVPDSRLWQVLEDVQLASFVFNLPGQLDFVLSERGSNLSLGQRQLLCLGRAALRETRIVLMDEVTASVDLETEICMQQAMERIFTEKTVIAIAHRLETLKDYDFIAVLGNGQLVDFGPPADILLRFSEGLEDLLQ